MYKKILATSIALLMSVSLFSGCGVGATDEEKAEKQKQEMLQTMAKEEAATGLKRLTSENLEDSEIVLREFVEGLQKNDSEMVAKAIGSPNVFEGDLLYEWMIVNDHENIKNTPLQDIRIKSKKEGPKVILEVFTDANIEGKTPILYSAYYVEGKWSLAVSGVVQDFTFSAPTKKVSLKGTSLEQYAKSVEDNGSSWTFVVPRMANLKGSPTYEITSNLGTFDAKMYQVKDANILLANMTDIQKTEFDGYATTAINNIFTMLKDGATATEVSSILLSETLILACYPPDEAKASAYREKLATVSSVTIFPDDTQKGYPEAYTYRLSGENAIAMNVKLKIPTTAGEGRKKATIIMQNFDGVWKIVNITTNGNDNIFFNLTTFNPAW